MLDDTHLTLGLNAMARAHRTDFFADGHRGAALIAACLFCREAPVEAGVPEIIKELLDRHWANSELCGPFPDEAPEPAGIERLLEYMMVHLEGLRHAGHNVILPALALRGFRLLPEAVTPARVDGICRLIACFDTPEPLPPYADDRTPGLRRPEELVAFVLTEYLASLERFEGRGQGWSGHLLTLGRALLDLRRLGYEELARRAESALRPYLARVRMGPQEIDLPRPEHAPSPLRPHQLAYWEHRRGGGIEIGHPLKYPYGFYGLVAACEDADLVDRCFDTAWRLF